MTDLSTRTPSGDGVTQRVVEKPAFGEDLLECILYSDNLRRAWNRVRANKGAAGVDGMVIDEFLDWAKAGHWKRVVNELETGRTQSMWCQGWGRALRGHQKPRISRCVVACST
ncbi:MAG: hypothetical protein AB8B97_18510 [Granulosicoccus sp.]